MNAAGIEYLVERGIRVIGTDAYGLDKPFSAMAERYEHSGGGSKTAIPLHSKSRGSACSSTRSSHS